MSLYRIMPKIPKYRVGLTNNMDRVYKQLGHEHGRMNKIYDYHNAHMRDHNNFRKNIFRLIVRVIDSEFAKQKDDRGDG